MPLRVRDRRDTLRDVTVACGEWKDIKREGPAYRKIDDGIGYVDLNRLERGAVDAMFDALGGMRALVRPTLASAHG